MLKKVTIFFILVATLLFSSDLTSVGFNSEIFFSYNAKGEIVAVTKKFEDPTALPKEKRALEYLHRMPFDHITAPKVLRVSKADGSLTMRPARGKSLTQLIQNAAKNEKEFLLLVHAVRKTALGFSELHQKTNYYKTKVPPSYFEQQEVLEKGFLQLTRTDRSLSLSARKMSAKLKQLKKLLSEEELQAAVIHGDPHTGNLFYDEKKDKLTMIDLLDMAPSLQRDRGGPLARDALYARLYIKVEAEYYSLSEKQIQELTETFDANYSVPISEATRDYYTFLFYADLIHSFRNFKSDDPSLESQAAFFYNSAVFFLKNS